MKLIDKQTISTRKSNERKREVEEGMTLAKSIDQLRKTHSEEQLNLKRFRDATISIIKREIESLNEEANKLKSEVVSLKEERILAQAPIDLVHEWNLLKEKSIVLAQDLKSLIERETSIIEKESSVKVRENAVFVREEKILENSKLTDRYLVEARTKYDQSETRDRESKELQTITEKHISSEENRLRIYESDLAVREKNLSLESANVENEKMRIEQEKLHIESQQQALRQAWNNIRSLQNKK